MKRIGITLRLSSPQAYSEPRDSLARDWYRFLAELGCGNRWLLLPNLGAETVAYARVHEIEALILTGGDNFGVDPLRDDSELALLEYAVAAQMPVLGICRGVQLIHRFYGGQLGDADRQTHVAQRHRIFPTTSQPVLPWQDEIAQTRSVNSFHGRQLSHPVPAPLQSWACDEHGVCEALVYPQHKIAGVMWHPEREAVFSPSDQRLCRWLFE